MSKKLTKTQVDNAFKFSIVLQEMCKQKVDRSVRKTYLCTNCDYFCEMDLFGTDKPTSCPLDYDVPTWIELQNEEVESE